MSEDIKSRPAVRTVEPVGRHWSDRSSKSDSSPSQHCATDAKELLWQRLQNRQLGGFRFHRELLIPPYVVDFACLGRRLVVEITESKAVDAKRTIYLEASGYKTLRFRRRDVTQKTDAVLDSILSTLTKRLRK